jgi:hypothetical protein
LGIKDDLINAGGIWVDEAAFTRAIKSGGGLSPIFQIFAANGPALATHG